MNDEFHNTVTGNEHIQGKVIHVIDYRIPLWGLLGAFVFIAWAGITIWFNVGALNKSVNDLQILVSNGNSTLSTINSDVALLKFRESDLESQVHQNTREIGELKK